jgi:CheY-like chemotaxis protein
LDGQEALSGRPDNGFADTEEKATLRACAGNLSAVGGFTPRHSLQGRALMSVILIVEDDAFIHEYMEVIIQELGHETLSASDMDGALSLLHAPRQIDLLVTDIFLKKAASGGIELAHQAIQIRPKLPVLYTTGNTVTDELKSLFVKDARYLRKPYTLWQLQNSIGELLTTRF